MLDHLRRRADGDDAVGIEPGDARFRLEVRVVDELRLIAVLDHDVRGSQSRLDVALFQLPARDQVALFVDEGRAVLERGRWVRHGRQLLVLDIDELDGRKRGVFALSGDNRDRLAVVADDTVGEHVRAGLQRAHLECLPWHVDPDGVLRHIFRGQHRRDSGHRLCHGRVDAQQTGVWNVGALERRVQHAGETEVGGESGPARHLLDRVVPDERAPDDRVGALHNDGHAGPSRSR